MVTCVGPREAEESMEGKVMLSYSWGSLLLVALKHILQFGVKAPVQLLHAERLLNYYLHVLHIQTQGDQDEFIHLPRKMNRMEIHPFNKYLWNSTYVQGTEANIYWKIISFTSKGTSDIFQVNFQGCFQPCMHQKAFFFFFLAKSGQYLSGSKLDSTVCEKKGERETDLITGNAFWKE